MIKNEKIRIHELVRKINFTLQEESGNKIKNGINRILQYKQEKTKELIEKSGVIRPSIAKI